MYEKIVGCFWTWQKGVFCLFFQALMLLWFAFCVSGKVGRVLKFLVFPSFGGFVGWLILVYLGLEGLGVFVFLVFVFRFCVGFVSVLFALFWFCCWTGFGVGSCFGFVSIFSGIFVLFFGLFFLRVR